LLFVRLPEGTNPTQEKKRKREGREGEAHKRLMGGKTNISSIISAFGGKNLQKGKGGNGRVPSCV